MNSPLIWIGAVIINLAFISIVSVSAGHSYLGGFFVCLVYTILLFKVAQYSEQGQDQAQPLEELQDLDTANQDENDIDGIATGAGASTGTHINTSTTATPGRKALSGFFYGLGVLALAASGFLLVMSILGDGSEPRHYAIGNIFSTAIPVISVSIFLWTKKFVAPCGFTAYVGIAMLGISIYGIINPDDNPDVSFLKWWFFATSVAWILGLSYLSIVSKNEQSQAPISWGLNTGALVFYSIMFAVVEIQSDGITNWIMINVFSFLPLIFVGILTDQNFMVFLGALGLLVDAWRLSSDWGILVHFVFLAVSGLGVMFMGSWLQKNQDKLRQPILSRINGHSSSETEYSALINSSLEEGLLNETGSSNTTSSAFCCADQETVFGVIGAIIVNSAFISIVSVSVGQSYLGGFITCSIYTIFLFFLARCFEERNDHGDSGRSLRPYQTFVAFSYGLGVLALAVSGFLLVRSIFGDGGEPKDYAIGNIFAIAIPVILVSIFLWTKKYVAPCGFTTYLGIAILGVSINFNWLFLKWWFFATSVVWILGLSYLSIVSKQEEQFQAPITWGLNTGALAFYSVMFAVVEIWMDGVINWIMINLFSFLPLIFVGILTDRTFMVFLGASGFLVDAWRLSSGWGILVQFVFLAMSGLGVMFMGSWLQNNQEKLREPILSWINSHSSLSNDNANNVDIPTEAPIEAPIEADNNETDSNYELMPEV